MTFFICVYLLLRVLVDGLLYSSDSEDENSNYEESPETSQKPSDNQNSDPDQDPDEDPDDESDEEETPSEILKEDLATLGRAKQGHEQSLDYLEEQYRTFFVGTSSRKEALEQIESYLEDELTAEDLSKNASLNFANLPNTKPKRGLDDDSDEEPDDYQNSKRPKLDNNDSNNNSGPSTEGSGSGPTTPPNETGGSSNNKISHQIIIYFIYVLSSIAESVSNFFSNIL